MMMMQQTFQTRSLRGAASARTNLPKGVERRIAHVVARRTYASASGSGSSSGREVIPSPSDLIDEITYYGPNRPKVFGPLSENIVPPHLTGEYPGDYGWDWLDISSDAERFEFMRQAEVINGRWALLGVVGCLVPEYLAGLPGYNLFENGVWFRNNAAALTPEGASLLGWNFGVGNNLPFLFASTVISLGYVEAFRFNKKGGGFKGPYDRLYPGWDPLGLVEDPEQFAELKVKEIKNARLAMVAFFGFVVQALVTGKGPLQNLSEHLADPGKNNAVAFIANANAQRIL